MIYLVIISFVIYITYNIFAICKMNKIPICLSETYYEFPKWVFPIIMIVSSGLLLPVWLELLEGSNFQFMSFITCTSIMFVGIACDYKNDKLIYKVHSISAYVACIFSLLCICIILNCWIYLLVIAIIIFGLTLSINLQSIKTNWLYYIETIVFLTTYISIIKLI